MSLNESALTRSAFGARRGLRAPLAVVVTRRARPTVELAIRTRASARSIGIARARTVGERDAARETAERLGRLNLPARHGERFRRDCALGRAPVRLCVRERRACAGVPVERGMEGVGVARGERGGWT